jgi:hypothetical protein
MWKDESKIPSTIHDDAAGERHERMGDIPFLTAFYRITVAQDTSIPYEVY